MPLVLDFLRAGLVIGADEVALLTQDVDEARRVLDDVVRHRLQRRHELLLAGGLELGRITLGEEEIADQLLVRQPVEEAGAGAGGDLHLPETEQGFLALAVERPHADVDEQVGVGQRPLAATLLWIQEFVHRTAVEREATLDARVIAQAVRLLGQQFAVRVDVARTVEVVRLVRRLAADLGTDRVVVHERRARPDIHERDVAIEATAAILQFVALGDVGNQGLPAQRLGAILHVQVAGLVIRVQRPAAESADLGHRNRPIVAEKVGPDLARMRFVGRGEVAVAERATDAFRDARVATGAVVGKDELATTDRTLAELLLELGDEIGARVDGSGVGRLARPCSRHLEIGLVGLGGSEEIEQVLQAILDRPEFGAVAPALADVERRLGETALRRVDLAHVGEVVDPALLGTRADVEVDTLDSLQRADRVLAALQDVVYARQDDSLAAEIDRRRIVVTRALQPALAVATRLAPALVLVLLGAAGGGLAPLADDLAREYWPLGDIDERIDRPRVVDLVVRDRRGIGHPRAGMREHLVFEAADRHPRAEQFRHARVLVADQPLDVLPFRFRRIGGRVERIEGDVARATRGADQERWFDRRVGQLAHPLVRFDAGLRRQRPRIAAPVGEAAVELLPARGVEARIGELANSQGAGRGTELQVAGRMPLVELAALAVRIVGIERRVLEAAGRVDVAAPANVLEQHVVPRAPVEPVGLVERLRRAIGFARPAAGGVVDDPPSPETVVALVGTENAEPVDEDADTLLESVGVEAVVARRRLEPDQPSDALGLVEPLARTGLAVGCILIDCRGLGQSRRRPGNCRSR
ncbi:MAG: hypothetical protein AW08_03162 [Candidatus Accumulibacter adjunctus]|uniref:Uncharacterized protein n=1 Tax=Candidatus Accumulibacter adjunctus TaxID=1454001 RepID=A0A011MSH8_9PROT|nr:MAG: hypothetical protein AW08_03162 [Candidatus Accumulibacter adjunctus]